MTELERALIALGDELEFPPAPDAWPRVAERLQRRRWIRPAVFALAASVLALGIAFAVPPARSAILKFFHIGSVTVERVDTLPPAQTQPFATGLAGNVLLWLQSGVTYRLEGQLTKGQMLALARQITP